jgi:hypothetical protein
MPQSIGHASADNAGNETINFLKSRRSIPEKIGDKKAPKAGQIYRTIL